MEALLTLIRNQVHKNLPVSQTSPERRRRMSFKPLHLRVRQVPQRMPNPIKTLAKREGLRKRKPARKSNHRMLEEVT